MHLPRYYPRKSPQNLRDTTTLCQVLNTFTLWTLTYLIQLPCTKYTNYILTLFFIKWSYHTLINLIPCHTILYNRSNTLITLSQEPLLLWKSCPQSINLSLTHSLNTNQSMNLRRAPTPSEAPSPSTGAPHPLWCATYLLVSPCLLLFNTYICWHFEL